MPGKNRDAKPERRVDRSKRELVERLKADETLNQPWEQLLSIFDAIDEKVYVSDPETHEILYANPAKKSLFGQDIVGQKCHRAFQGLDEPCDFCNNHMIFGENLGKTHIWEFQNRKTGNWLRCIDRAIRWSDGRTARFEMAISIHDRKAAEETLRRSEQEYRSIVEDLNEIIYTADATGRFTYVSPVSQSITGYTPFEVVGRFFSDFIFVEDLDHVRKRWAEVLSGQLKPTEFRVVKKSGEKMWARTFSKPVFQDGKAIGLRGVLLDITEYKETEAALQEREKELRAKTVSLEEVNAALRVLLKRMEEDKKELEDKVRLNIQQMIQPYLERLKAAGLGERQRGHLDKLEANLNEIMSPFTKKLLAEHPRLTPAELQIANLIRQGKSSKEIADDLGLSLRTVETHRRNMRNKLGIRDKKTNLRSYLLTNQYT